MRSVVRVGVPPAVSFLEPFVAAGVFGSAEVQLCATFARLSPAMSDEVGLALAVAARGPRLGHVCMELADVARLVVDRDEGFSEQLPWPDVAGWAAALESSDLVGEPAGYLDAPLKPLIWDGRRLYLQRYFRHEVAVADDLVGRSAPTTVPEAILGQIDVALDAMFGLDDPDDPDLQRRAARIALTQCTAVIAGGPGTGKTRTIARMLAAAQQVAAANGRTLHIALAAPTGKAAARMTEALHAAVAEAQAEGVLDVVIGDRLRESTAVTLHRLLGWVPGGSFRRSAESPLPHDLVVVDETSMVSLPLMAALLDAVRPAASIVLVGDPFQLASIEAGSVMSDVVGLATPGVAPADGAPLAGRVTVLTRSRRFTADSGIAALASAIRIGDADRAFDILDGPAVDAVWVRDTDSVAVKALVGHVVDAAIEVVHAAESGDAVEALAAATRVKVIAATRHRQFGLHDWSERIEDGVARAVVGYRRNRRWYSGRPIIVTANDYPNRLANGDVGVVVRHGDGQAVAFPTVPDIRYVPPSQLDRVDTWWAMTIHKSQGSEFPHAVVSLPPAPSPVLTRELLYTAVTRAQERVTIVGSEAAMRLAIERRITRASGLRDRLWTTP